MTAVTDIISQSLRDIGVLGDGQTPSAEQANSAFVTIKQMMAAWNTENLYVFAQVETSFTPTAALSYTVGTGGDISMTRPSSIDAAFYRLGTLDTPIQILQSFEDYERIPFKTLPGSYPAALYYNPTYPLGTIYLFPQATTGTVRIVSRVQFPAYSTIADSIGIPDEDAMAVRYSLSELLAAENQVPLRPDVAMMAKRYRAALKRANSRIPELRMPDAISRRRKSNILAGY